MGDKDFYLYIEGKKVKVSEEVYREYYKGERKERYFMKDLKRERVKVDPETGTVTIIPSREDSYERLTASKRQFAAPGEDMEDQAVRSLLLKQAMDRLTEKERAMVEELYYLERTERQVSEALHMAKATLRRRHREVLGKLREFLENER